jgi:hypothetical protein
MTVPFPGDRPESLTIRPPSEWRSLLLRSTRGCNWNRCKFCGVYPALGEPHFSLRPLGDILRDIDWYAERMPDFTTAFIGDADPLCRPLDESVQLITALRQQLPSLRRITAYARAATLYRIGEMGLRRLAEAGLTRVHIGLESGDLPTLKFHCKGQSPRMVTGAAFFARNAGVEVSMYVLLGLGGRERWKEHIDGTAAVINATDPEFVRLRRIWLFTPESAQVTAVCPLVKEIESGSFVQQTPEGTVHELQRLVTAIDGVHSYLVCDHANNYVTVDGVFPDDKKAMITAIDQFLALPPETRERHYAEVGSQI